MRPHKEVAQRRGKEVAQRRGSDVSYCYTRIVLGYSSYNNSVKMLLYNLPFVVKIHGYKASLITIGEEYGVANLRYFCLILKTCNLTFVNSLSNVLSNQLPYLFHVSYL